MLIFANARFRASGLLCFVFAAAVAAASVGEDVPPSAVPDEKPVAFGFDDVALLAEKLAAAPYQETPALPSGTNGALDSDAWMDLVRRSETVFWNEPSKPFFVRLLPVGYIYSRSLAVHVIDKDGQISEPVPTTKPRRQNGGQNGSQNAADAAAPDVSAPTGYGGFALGTARGILNDADKIPFGEYLGGVGTAHLNFRAANARRGGFCRTTTVNVASPKDEIYTYFREVWLVEPQEGDRVFVFYALLDSPVLTGAVRFDIEPGSATVARVREKLFKRGAAAVPEKIGVAPTASMFLRSEAGLRPADDFRPEVHGHDGLLFRVGDAVSWRPLHNPERLLVTDFPVENLNGFGLMQRDDNFDHYQDLEKRFELSSSVWVEPEADWGAGKVELLEIPGSRDVHNNILAYWSPSAETLRKGLESGGLDLAYRLYWMPPGFTPHELGRVADTRLIHSSENGTNAVSFVVDFVGGDLKNITADMGLVSEVETPDQATLAEKTLTKNPVTGGWRLLMKFTLPQDGILQNILKAREGGPRLRFAARLRKGENIPEPLTETWIYNLTY